MRAMTCSAKVKVVVVVAAIVGVPILLIMAALDVPNVSLPKAPASGSRWATLDGPRGLCVRNNFLSAYSEGELYTLFRAAEAWSWAAQSSIDEAYNALIRPQDRK